MCFSTHSTSIEWVMSTWRNFILYSAPCTVLYEVLYSSSCTVLSIVLQCSAVDGVAEYRAMQSTGWERITLSNRTYCSVDMSVITPLKERRHVLYEQLTCTYCTNSWPASQVQGPIPQALLRHSVTLHSTYRTVRYWSFRLHYTELAEHWNTALSDFQFVTTWKRLDGLKCIENSRNNLSYYEIQYKILK